MQELGFVTSNLCSVRVKIAVDKRRTEKREYRSICID